MPASPSIKYIYVTRDARDVCLSFYKHLSHQAEEDGGYTKSMEEFVRDWSGGSIGEHLRAGYFAKLERLVASQTMLGSMHTKHA